LLVNDHPGRSLSHFNKLCPHFKTHNETQSHFLTCHEITSNWSAAETENLPNSIKQSNLKELIQILSWATSVCRSNNSILPQALHQPLYFKLIEEQSNIGRNQILKGRLSTEWVHHFELAYPTQVETIVAQLITSLWKAVIEIWHKRCELLHKHNKDSTNHAIQQLQPQLETIYEMKPRLDVTDQQILEQTLHSTLAMTPKAIRDWIKRVGTFAKQGLIRTRRYEKLPNHAITSFFLPRSRDNSRLSILEGMHPETNANPPNTSPDPNANENKRPP
jgi:hypothetical protein